MKSDIAMALRKIQRQCDGVIYAKEREMALLVSVNAGTRQRELDIYFAERKKGEIGKAIARIN